MKSYVYEIKNIHNGKLYVGKSNHPEKRYKQHVVTANSNGKPLSKAIAKYGESSFDFKIVGEFQSEEEAYSHERQLIELHIASGQLLYNLSAGGRGIILTPQLREKMMVVWKSKERLKKISDASLQNWKNQNFRNNIVEKARNVFLDEGYRKKHSEATRAGMDDVVRKKISDANRGRVQNETEKLVRAESCRKWWTDERRRERGDKQTCEQNANAKLRRNDVVKCRVLKSVFNIAVSQIIRILSLPSKAVTTATAGNTWKSVTIKDDSGNLTDEAFSALVELLDHFPMISPSAKTKRRVELTTYAQSISKVATLYESWVRNHNNNSKETE